MFKVISYSVEDSNVDLAKEWTKENNVEMTILHEPLTMETIELAKGHDGISVSQMQPITREMYEKLAEFGMKQIAQRSAGYDTHDLQAATDNGIIVTNVPVYSPESIAEFAVTGALMSLRHLPFIMDQAQEYDFTWTPDKRGRVLRDMTVGILGVGNIGREAARIFKGIGCEVIGYDLVPTDAGREFLEYKDSAEEVIKQADVISLHMPLTELNHHLFNMDMFKKMKPDAVLINTARGGIIDTEDLLNALDDNLLAHAFLDVYEHEEDYVMYDHRNKEISDKIFKALLEHPKVTYTPHLAFCTDVANRNILFFGLDGMLDVLKTGDSAKRVN